MNLLGKNQESANDSYPDILCLNGRKHVEDLFREKDKDHNGKLSWEEFCGEKTPTEKAFGIMDVDNNGRVSKEVKYITLVCDTYNLPNNISGVQIILQSFINQTSGGCLQKV